MSANDIELVLDIHKIILATPIGMLVKNNLILANPIWMLAFNNLTLAFCVKILASVKIQDLRKAVRNLA